MTDEKYEFEEVEVQLGDSKEIKSFKKVLNFKQNGRNIELDYSDFNPSKPLKDEDGLFYYEHYLVHAELYGKVVSKIKRV